MPAASAIRTALAGYRWGIERKRELIRKDAHGLRLRPERHEFEPPV